MQFPLCWQGVEAMKSGIGCMPLTGCICGPTSRPSSSWSILVDWAWKVFRIRLWVNYGC